VSRELNVTLYEEKRLIREAVSQLLEPHSDLRVISAVSSLRGLLGELDRQAPDVVVTGLQYAPALIAATTRVDAHARTPIVVYSTDDETDQAAMFAAIAAGANGVLTGEAGADQLAAAIRAVARGEAMIDSKFAKLLLDRYRRGQGLSPTATCDRALSELTPRELEILGLVSSGLPNSTIASMLFISPATVRTHVYRLCLKLEVHDRAHLVAMAYRTGLVARLGLGAGLSG
jgi:DNA-binding NarL/FixJ family response regulator